MPSIRRLHLRSSHTLLAALVAACVASWPAQAQSTGAQRSAKYYEDALQRYEKSDLAGAAVQLRNAIQNDRKNIAAQLLLGRVLLAWGSSRQPKLRSRRHSSKA